MSDTYIYFAIVLTAIATYLPRFLGVFSSDFVDEDENEISDEKEVEFDEQGKLKLV